MHGGGGGRGDLISASGGYHNLCIGLSLGCVQCIGEYHQYIGGYQYCCGTPQCTDDIPHTNHAIPPMHS